MTVASCEICKGARVLPMGLGRCVCVTPEAMLALEKALEEAREPWKVAETLSRLPDAELDGALETLLDKEADALTAAILRAGWALETQPVRDALSDALVSLGLPAHPTGALENPALERLVETIH